MLPLEKPWYSKLLLFALLLGIAGGLAALVYIGITGTASAFLFGNNGTGWWSGHWWWILITALGGLAVAALRSAWKVPEKVPGAIAVATAQITLSLIKTHVVHGREVKLQGEDPL